MNRKEVKTDRCRQLKALRGHAVLVLVISICSFSTAVMATDPSAENPGPDGAFSASATKNDAGSADRARLRDRFSGLSYSDELPPGLTLEEFEATLQAQFYGTFVFYSKLPSDKRMQIYWGYRDQQHIAGIRASTLELLR